MTTFGVVVFPGSNCDRDCLRALERLGIAAREVRHDADDLGPLDAVVLPGGFSYGDYLRAGAIARFAPAMRAVRAFADRGGPVLGICNGFQILVEAGLLPGALLPNRSSRFVCRPVRLEVTRRDSIFTSACPPTISLPVAHGQGRYHADAETIRRLEGEGRIAFRYAADDDPNGSVGRIAGVLNERGNVLGLMPHPERAVEEEIGGSTDGCSIFLSLAAALAGAAA